MLRSFGGILFAALFLAGPAWAEPIPVRVVVVATFEPGEDTGDAPGEFQYWVERLPLPETLPFPQGYRALRYDPDKHVLGLVTGEGAVHGAASVMALGMDTRFDLSKAYWVIAGIAGINPAAASVGSAAWAEWVVDRDLNFEIDAREIPEGWSTGHVPLGRKAPFEQPAPPISGSTGTFAYRLNGALVDWAYRTTRDTALDDTKDLQAIRRGYPDYPNAQKPPFVLKGDNAAASDFWIGARMNDLAIGWVDYWTQGKGRFVTTAMEDAGMLQSLTFLAQAKRADLARVLLLRTGANYTLPPEGETAARMLAHEAGEDAALSAYLPSLEAAYRVGSRVVTELAGHWERYETTRPDEVTP